MTRRNVDATLGPRRRPRWEAHGRVLVSDVDRVPAIMGIVNVTPDSFSDGGKLPDAATALAHARQLAIEGAAILDIGGESSRPGAAPVSAEEELARVLPAIERIAHEVRLPISIDTTKAEVALRAVDAGACVINDITALAGDPDMLRVAAETGAGVVLMHMKGEPRTMQQNPHYRNVVKEVYDHLGRRIDAAVAAGIPLDHIAVDPGIGFGKTSTHNLELLRNLERFATLGCVVLIGLSRKRFLGELTGRPVDQRETATVVASLAAAVNGAAVLRVHDVKLMADTLKIWTAVAGWGPLPKS